MRRMILTLTDPVGPTEIAERLRVARTTVHQWGQRRATCGFPLPDATISGSPLWEWATIDAWALARKI